MVRAHKIERLLARKTQNRNKLGSVCSSVQASGKCPINFPEIRFKPRQAQQIMFIWGDGKAISPWEQRLELGCSPFAIGLGSLGAAGFLLHAQTRDMSLKHSSTQDSHRFIARSLKKDNNEIFFWPTEYESAYPCIIWKIPFNLQIRHCKFLVEELES